MRWRFRNCHVEYVGPAYVYNTFREVETYVETYNVLGQICFLLCNKVLDHDAHVRQHTANTKGLQIYMYMYNALHTIMLFLLVFSNSFITVVDRYLIQAKSHTLLADPQAHSPPAWHSS